MYSPALRQYAGSQSQWTEEALDTFIHSPRTEVPGTIMGFNGIDDEADRAALISYLKSLSD